MLKLLVDTKSGWASTPTQTDCDYVFNDNCSKLPAAITY
jgi:hypothetical protein